MQAIRTKYFGPTNFKGSHIQAKCEAKTIKVAYDHGLNIDENHKAAMLKLCAALGWNTDHYADMVGGVFAGAHYWVFDDKRLKALKGIVNSMRAGTWSGSPWGYPEFRKAAEVIGADVGYYGDGLNAPTKPEEIAEFLTRKG